MEDSETVARTKKLRKKAPQTNVVSTLLTDAEIEQQFGERLSPTVKTEHDEDIQSTINSRVIVEIERLPRTPIERAREKLTKALERRSRR
jgi:hypothetical protein